MQASHSANCDTAPNATIGATKRPRVVAGVVDMVIPGITGAYARRFIVDRRGSEAVWLRPLAGPPGARLMLPRATFDALVDGGGA